MDLSRQVDLCKRRAPQPRALATPDRKDRNLAVAAASKTVQGLLGRLGIQHYAAVFDKHGLDLAALRLLTLADLEGMGVALAEVRHQRLIGRPLGTAAVGGGVIHAEANGERPSLATSLRIASRPWQEDPSATRPHPRRVKRAPLPLATRTTSTVGRRLGAPQRTRRADWS